MKIVSYNIRFGLGTDHQIDLERIANPPGRNPGHGVRLDYCFVSPDLGHKVESAWVDSAALGSDHLPYWVELDH